MITRTVRIICYSVKPITYTSRNKKVPETLHHHDHSDLNLILTGQTFSKDVKSLHMGFSQ